MLEIKVIHEIKFSKDSGQLLQLVVASLTALAGGTTQQAAQSAPVVEEKAANGAEKTRYFQHEPTGELMKVEKGDSLDFLGADHRELKPVEYNRLKHEQGKAVQQAAEETAEQASTSDANDPVDDTKDAGGDVAIPTVEDLRVVAAKFQRNKKQKDLKAILDKYGAPKLSAIPDEHRAEALELMKTTADELGLA